jgi:hypothetical protein
MAGPPFFIDRSLGGKIVARLLRADGWDIVTMREFYGRAGDRMSELPGSVNRPHSVMRSSHVTG